jgi:hypothetical protein
VDYVKVEDARDKPGLRLALTMGVPGPWSQAAKYLFEYKDIPFMPVGQVGTQDNPELFDWTGHRNAPVAVFEGEAPRVGWYEIIMLAERIAPTPRLLPKALVARAATIGLIAEMAAPGGFAWQRRLQMVDVMYAASDDPKARKRPDILAARYGHNRAAADQSHQACSEFLNGLAAHLEFQAARGSDYLVGDSFTAADLYWACFSQLLMPMADDLNPMPERLRGPYTAPETLTFDPMLIIHRNTMYERHLSLPLEF